MTRFQRFKHFISYFWKNSAILIGFSVAFIAFPSAMTFAGKWQWSDWSLWFWIVIAINTMSLAMDIFKYLQYINFNR